MPNPSGPLSASPDSLTMTRRYFGTAMPRSFSCPGSSERRSPFASVPGGGGDLGGEIPVRTIDPLAQRVAHEARDLDRAADLAFGVLERLADRLVGIMDIGLIQQAGFLVEGLETGLDDLR